MPGFWRQCRIAFRCVRITAWLLVLAVICLFLWCNRVGLPDFLKTRLVATLREHGVELEFSRMRLNLVRGFVAENVRVGQAGADNQASLAARFVQLELDWPALFRQRRLELNGLVVRDGRFTLPLSPTNSLLLTNLQTELRFGVHDTWSLDNFRADFAGAQIAISGEVAHASEVRHWKTFSGPKTDRGSLIASLNIFADKLRRIHFQGQPRLRLSVTGDARNVHSILVRLRAAAEGVSTPWLSAHGFQTDASLTAPVSAVTNEAAAWGFWTNLQPFRLMWLVHLDRLNSPQLNGTGIACAGGWSAPTLAVTNLVAESIRTPRFVTHGIQAQAALTAPASPPPSLPADRGFWTNLEPFRLGWSVRLAELHSPQFRGEAVRCNGTWSAPTLTISNLSAQLEGGQLAASAVLDVPARTLTFTNDSDFNLSILDPWLPEPARRQLAQVTWSHPPVIHAAGAVRLPVWTNAVNDWRERMESSLQVRGDVAFTNAIAAGVALDRVRARFSYADLLWELSDLTMAQGRTKLELSGQESEATKNFHGRLAGQVDAASVRPFLKTPNALHGFELVSLSQPLHLTLDVSGNLRTLNRLTATGRVALTNFAVRGQTVDSVTSAVFYTNFTVDFLQPRLARAGGSQTFGADRVILDLKGERLFIEGGAGRLEPMVVGRAIGPKTAADMEPYEFLDIPTARVAGCIPLKQKNGDVVQDDADLWVDIVGTAHFRWRKFETPSIAGRIHWWNHNLILTNVVSECYGGEARGWATFDLRPEIVGTDFSFDAAGTNVDLQRMGLALWSPTNRLEGALAGTVTVTRANSSDWHSWNGYGRLQLRDGLLWDVPIFAFMSPILNAVSPGLGNSRAKDAEAKFVITNGVITTDSLLISSTMMRLQYAGSVDLQQNVNARVTAQLLRNTPVVGSLVSAVLWPVSKIFECHVTGDLDQPIVKPVFIPKILLVPLHPWRSLEDFLMPFTNTNAPAMN